MTDRAPGAASAEIERWADAEFLPWRADRGSDVAAAIDVAVRDDDSIYLFRIADGRVTLATKNEEWSAPDHPLFVRWQALTLRADLYRRLFQDAVDTFALRGEADLAVELDDLVSHPSLAPVLCFQKPRGSIRILVPDIDFLVSACYLSDDIVDTTALSDKDDRAVFVGSTTGMLNISQDIVNNHAHQRIRSARFFKGHADVVFELPGIVQCDGDDTEQLIRSFELGSAFHSWQTQFRSRYILSLDGNGATCSRVAIALASNSVLIRYQSPNELHYFWGLSEWEHYVPVRDDEGVVTAIAFLRLREGLGSRIARDASRFYRRYLTRAGILTYTAAILQRYIKAFGSRVDIDAGNDEAPLIIDSAGLFTTGEALWSAPGGWLRQPGGAPLKELWLMAGPAVASDDFAAEIIRPDGRAVSLPDFFTRAPSNEPGGVLGLRINLREEAADRFRVSYEAEFVDGTVVGPVMQGRWCSAASGAAMKGVRIRSVLRVERRDRL